MTWLKDNAAVVGLILALAGSGFTQWSALTNNIARIEEHLRFNDIRIEHLERKP